MESTEFSRTTDGRSRTGSWEYAWLTYATLLNAFGLLVHTADHLHRGTDVLSAQVFWAGNISTIAGAVVIVLVLMRHAIAPLAALLLGFPVAIGVAAVHLLPHWSAFSDAFPGAHHTGVTPVSWAVVLIEITGALAVGVTAALVLRQSGPPPAASRNLSPRAQT